MQQTFSHAPTTTNYLFTNTAFLRIKAIVIHTLVIIQNYCRFMLHSIKINLIMAFKAANQDKF